MQLLRYTSQIDSLTNILGSKELFVEVYIL